MEEYPEELRTPPITLISIVVCPELHNTISKHLHSEQPPINTIALPDFTKISLFSKSKLEDPSPSPLLDILKHDWLTKHQIKIPSILAALFFHSQLSSDPASWLQVCSHIDQIKTKIVNDYFLKKKIQFFSFSLPPYQNFAFILTYYLLCAEGINAFISKY